MSTTATGLAATGSGWAVAGDNLAELAVLAVAECEPEARRFDVAPAVVGVALTGAYDAPCAGTPG
jgi:hypothetical protein